MEKPEKMNGEGGKVVKFWSFIDSLRTIAEKSAKDYSINHGLAIPHTVTTIKPSGTISKIMNCTEGAHLPSMLYYLRWIIFPKDGQKHKEFESRGYPIQDVSHQYDGCIVVGFPTKQPIVDTIPEDLICTADNTKPEDHFTWLRLLEKYWLGGSTRNNQISYTLKYNPNEMSYPEFMEMILENQPTIKCCAVMPIEDVSAYAYTPEQSVTKEKYEELLSLIDVAKEEAYDEEKLECESGICPIEPKIRDNSHDNSIEAA